MNLIQSLNLQMNSYQHLSQVRLYNQTFLYRNFSLGMEVAISHTVSPGISDYLDYNTKNFSPSPHSLSLPLRKPGQCMLMLFLTVHAGFSARADMDSILDGVKVVVSMPQLMQLIPPVCLQRGCLLPLSARIDYKGVWCSGSSYVQCWAQICLEFFT